MEIAEKTTKKDQIEEIKKIGPWMQMWKRLRRNKLAVFGLVVFTIILLMAIFADLIVDFDMQVIKQNASIRLSPPNSEHWFGTDHFGRDIFARIVYGARSSLTIGITVTLVCLVIGGFIGSVAAYYGGRLDSIVMRTMDTIMSIPPILLALAVVAALGQNLQNLIIAMIVAQVSSFTRIVRSSIMSVVGFEYVEAAKACGTRDSRIILKHIIPNAIGPIIVQSTMSIARTIITAAGLSFIGMGIQPPFPEWGSMLAEGKQYMRYTPYLVVFPGSFIVLTALSLNVLGDGLRDALDPKLKK
jgi:peptide/nickel transport system permease protein